MYYEVANEREELVLYCLPVPSSAGSPIVLFSRVQNNTNEAGPPGCGVEQELRPACGEQCAGRQAPGVRGVGVRKGV
eukprot:SAG31_NODE_762_length_12275_cov_14.077119_6_plen_77_part_00